MFTASEYGSVYSQQKLFHWVKSLLFIGIEDHGMLAADWGSSVVNELDISSTELSENCLVNIFERMPNLTYLAVPNCDGFTDKVIDYSR